MIFTSIHLGRDSRAEVAPPGIPGIYVRDRSTQDDAAVAGGIPKFQLVFLNDVNRDRLRMLVDLMNDIFEARDANPNEPRKDDGVAPERAQGGVR